MNCPCKECLVRSACTNGRNCDKYMDLTDRNQPVINDFKDIVPETFKINDSIESESYESEV